MSHQSPPDESLLASLQELVEAYEEEENYSSVVSKCSSLLKKKKTLEPNIANAIQRLLLQSLIQQQDYAKVVELGKEHHDLVLYAQYRQDNYDIVSQQASKETLLEQHLLAQSYFHLNQPSPALRVYQDLLKDDDRDNNNSNDDEQQQQLQMELLTNAIAVVTSTVVPYVKTDSPLLEQAESFLEDHPEYCDLALNLGTLQCLTGSLFNAQWFEVAKEHCTDPADKIPIEINANWSRQFWRKDVAPYKIQGTGPQIAVAQLNQALVDQKPLPASPHTKWNALQVKMYWYNRAVQQYQSQQYVECQESCQSLKKTLGKKKKTESPAEWWWQSRVDVILAHVQQEHSKTDATAITKLQERLEGLQSQPTCDTIDHAMAFVQLHLHQLQYPSATKEQKSALLRSLPASIQSQPAVVATLDVLEQAQASGAKSKKDASPMDQAETLFHQGQYTQAAEIYETHLPAPSACNADQLVFQLKRVQALAMSDQHDASSQLWESLEPLLDNTEDPTFTDGEELEMQALPRSTKTHTALSATAITDVKPKRSKESILRQRARKREAFVKKLEEKGDYNPNAKPNPERWIPKHERSRARRKGQQSRSAQGGGSQADAQRLDAAARRAGNVPASAGPSTATLKVSQGGRKGGRRR